MLQKEGKNLKLHFSANTHTEVSAPILPAAQSQWCTFSFSSNFAEHNLKGIEKDLKTIEKNKIEKAQRK